MFGPLHGLDDAILSVVDGDKIELVAAVVDDGDGGGYSMNVFWKLTANGLTGALVEVLVVAGGDCELLLLF